MKKIIGVVLVGVCVLSVGCGQPAQEKAVQAAQDRNQTQYEAYTDPIPSLKSTPNPKKIVDSNAAPIKK